MNKFLVLILLWTAFFEYAPKLFAQTSYTVDIVVDDHWWQTRENFGVWLRAVISYNGIPIPNSNDYYYWWWAYFSNVGDWRILTSGFGVNDAVPETHQGWTIRVYVIVTDTVSHTFTDIISEQKGPFSAPGQTAQLVSFTPRQQNGGNIFPTVTANHWRYTIGQWKYYHDYPFLTQDHNETMQSTPSYVSSLGQKIKYWNGDVSNILNHNTFYVSAEFSNLSPQYWSVDGNVTVKTDLIDAPGTTGGNITFHDPWYIDYPDPNYGGNLRNRGMQEPRQFHSRSSPFNPNYDTPFPPSNQPYRGVFLGQEIAPGLPYYSVGAPSPNTFIIGAEERTGYFLNWTGSNVALQNANATQTGVVFQQSGATATARYKAHLASSSPNALSTSSQRKVVRDYSGKLHMVYESVGEIWYTNSTNGGATWSPEKLISDLDLVAFVFVEVAKFGRQGEKQFRQASPVFCKVILRGVES